jgi:integral membrane protein
MRMKKSVLTRYRVLAYVTGVLLVLLTLGVIAKYLLEMDGADSFTQVIGIAHGWLYVLYLVFAFDLGSKAKWPVRKQLWVLLAGTIPTAAFFVERRITHEVEGKIEDASPMAAKACSPAPPFDRHRRTGERTAACRRHLLERPSKLAVWTLTPSKRDADAGRLGMTPRVSARVTSRRFPGTRWSLCTGRGRGMRTRGSSGSGGPGSFRSPGGCIRPGTGGGPGRFGSSRGSGTPSRPTSGTR